MSRTLAPLSMLFLLGLAAPAFASDGVLEINHTCAATTGCFAGDAPGYPVTIAAAGSYRLTSNLTAPVAENGIEVEANDVWIDLNGFAVTGPYTCGIGCPPGSGRAGHGITETGSGGNLSGVRNGRVRGFQFDGIRLGSNARVVGVTLSALGGDAIELGSYSQASENSITTIGGRGIVLGLGSLYRDNTIAVIGRSVEGGRASGPNSCFDQLCGTAGKRFFYLTQGTFTGSQALTACDPGFHMASLWEIFDLGSVEYDTTRGATQADSGQGAVSSLGWARTGGSAATGGVAGTDNCDAWTSSDAADQGSYVDLSGDWSNDLASTTNDEIEPWTSFDRDCNLPAPVWCVQE